MAAGHPSPSPCSTLKALHSNKNTMFRMPDQDVLRIDLTQFPRRNFLSTPKVMVDKKLPHMV